jgi:hypothetical protein
MTSDKERREVTKIHTVDGSEVTVDGNFLVKLGNMTSIANLQSFDNKILVNINNVTYMEVMEDE